MNILNFIVIEGNPEYHSDRGDDEIFVYTIQGENFIPLETPVPVIRKGRNCIGIGMVTELSITKNSTTIYYTISDVSETSANAYYSLFRNQATISNSEEYQEDVIIPGMMRNISTSPKPSNYDYNDGKKHKEKHRGLMDSFNEDDNYHW